MAVNTNDNGGLLCRIRPKFCLVAVLSFPLPHLFATMFVFFSCSFSSLFSFFSSRTFSFSTRFYAGVTAPLVGLACTLQRFTLYGFALANALLDKAPCFRKPFFKTTRNGLFSSRVDEAFKCFVKELLAKRLLSCEHRAAAPHDGHSLNFKKRKT